MQISNHQIYNSLNAIKALSKFKLKGTVIFKLAKLMSFVEEHYSYLEFTKDQLIFKYGENGVLDKNHLNFKPFLTEWYDVLNQKVDCNFQRINLEDLDLDNNQIPIDLLSKLQWAIQDNT